MVHNLVLLFHYHQIFLHVYLCVLKQQFHQSQVAKLQDQNTLKTGAALKNRASIATFSVSSPGVKPRPAATASRVICQHKRLLINCS